MRSTITGKPFRLVKKKKIAFYKNETKTHIACINCHNAISLLCPETFISLTNVTTVVFVYTSPERF